MKKANQDIYDDIKLKKLFGLHGLYKKILQRCKEGLWVNP